MQIAQRTNCNNCGAPLVDGKCPYCGTEWFRPGVSFGRGIITAATVTFQDNAINSACFGDARETYVALHREPTAEVELKIIGMSADDLRRLMHAIGLARNEEVNQCNQTQ